MKSNKKIQLLKSERLLFSFFNISLAKVKIFKFKKTYISTVRIVKITLIEGIKYKFSFILHLHLYLYLGQSYV